MTPDIPVWSEESATIPYAERSGWEEFWLVDPLDGTKEFVKGNGEFTVNIALIKSPRAGSGRGPCSGDRPGLLWLQRRWRLPGRRRWCGPTDIRMSTGAAADSSSRQPISRESVIRKIRRRTWTPRHGSDGEFPKICLVAAGAADIYPRLGLTSEWDTAAAQAVVENAGGRVIDLEGQQASLQHQARGVKPFFPGFRRRVRTAGRTTLSRPDPTPNFIIGCLRDYDSATINASLKPHGVKDMVKVETTYDPVEAKFCWLHNRSS